MTYILRVNKKYIPHCGNLGFSLIQVSLLIAVAAIILVSMLPGGTSNSDAERVNITLQHMRAIEAAMQSFMATTLRRPCPASLTDTPASASFGVEQLSGGACASESGKAEYAGMVPVKTLNLPDEYAFDGYARRVEYRVDQRAVSAGASQMSDAVTSCFDMQSQGIKGSIRIMSAHNAPVADDYVMWALISRGKDKYGSYSMQGVGPLDGTADDDTAENIAIGGQLVRKEPTSTFDDIVWTAESTKNMCCLGKSCNMGFSVGNTGDTFFNINGFSIAAGDINGDGIKDLAFFNTRNASNSPATVYAIFGRKTGWPVKAMTSLTNLDGSNGFRFNYSCSGTIAAVYALAVGDLNGDGFDDIAVAGSCTGVNRKIAIVFGKSSFSSPVETTDLQGSTGGITIVSTASWSGTNMAIGKLSNGADGASACTACKDLIFATALPGHALLVLYGKPDWTSWGAGMTYTAGTPGVSAAAAAINSSIQPGSANGFIISNPSTTTYPLGNAKNALSVGDINNDGFDDIINGVTSANSSAGQAYVIFGRSDWSADIVYCRNNAGADPGCVAPYNTLVASYTFCPSSSPCADVSVLVGDAAKGIKFTAAGDTFVGSATDLADYDGDGMKDIFVSSLSNVYVYKGKSAGWTTPIDLAGRDISSFIINASTNAPVWATNGGLYAIPISLAHGDVNNDGKQDLLIGVSGNGAGASSPCGKGVQTASVYVLMQPSSGWASADLFQSQLVPDNCTGTELNSAFGGFRIDGASTANYAYVAVVTDLNNDGKNDIFIHARGYNHAVTSTFGGVFGLWGHTTLSWDTLYDLGDLE